MSVAIGTVLKPVGLRGEVKVAPLTDFLERFSALSDVMVQVNTQGTSRYKVERVRFRGTLVYLMLQGISSLTEADRLRGKTLEVADEQRWALPEGRYYIDDIEGMEVYLPQGSLLGTVYEVLQGNGNDVYVVRNGQQEWLIPAVQKVVTDISLAKNRMTIAPIDGLLDNFG